MPIIWTDTETCGEGLDGKQQAISIGACVTSDSGTPVPEHVFYTEIFEPDYLWDGSLEKVHGLTYGEVESRGVSKMKAAAMFREWCQEVSGFTNKTPYYKRYSFGGHNCQFDIEVLRVLGFEYTSVLAGNVVDTMPILKFINEAQAKLFRKPSFKNKYGYASASLDSALHLLNNGSEEIKRGAHNALEDAILTSRVWRRLVDIQASVLSANVKSK